MEKQPPSVNKLAGQYSFLDGEEPLTLTKKQLQSTLMAASLIYAYQQTYPPCVLLILIFFFSPMLCPPTLCTREAPQLPSPISGRKSGKAWGFSPSFLVLEPRNIPLPSADFRICSALLCPSASSFCRWSASRFSGKGMTKNHPFSLNSSWVTLIVLWVLEF
ncbi:hypothetical protein SLEP1_g39810 [Rubroshorea leprosula]|uniref:Uncharacterized protein n=1 Tax=Rubroshorea leprosula TaxID=152421 RepID=A0AAV5L1M6_9ROSI|nr:hypothetical protein SLEP1_g39810 [Rubroshorea leprosula]